MMGSSGLLAAVLAVVSVVSLSLLSLLCLRCKRKSKIIHEEHQIYNPQTFQRAGSVFAVTQSKTVTRTNQITSASVETLEDFPTADEQSDYQNISEAQTGSPEHTYVAPLPISVYENEDMKTRRTGPRRLREHLIAAGERRRGRLRELSVPGPSDEGGGGRRAGLRE
ncbi:uncharacterized protein LOC143333026 isoform X2 [Chaetodon auriga]|uniref:uncharacterized protein LOC143333026 isoform X2 n=1 Tax=Chaetodon auriga TaxID=39042 RepID=UPI004032CE17